MVWPTLGSRKAKERNRTVHVHDRLRGRTVRVHSHTARLRAVHTARTRPCTQPVDELCTRPCIRPWTRTVRPRTRSWTRTVHGRVHDRVHGPRTRPVYITVYTASVHERVHDRGHGPYTVVYTVHTRPCTRLPCTV